MSTPRHRDAQAGFTLPELLLVMVMSIIVVGLPLTLVISAASSQNQSLSRATTTAHAQVGVDRLVRDLREAVSATISSTTAPATAVLTVPTRRATATDALPAPTTVTWTCVSGGACTRTTSAGDATRLITGVTSATFTPTTLPGATQIARVDVALTVGILSQAKQETATVAGANDIVFRAGVDLRNLG